MVDLGRHRFISIEDVIERVVGALEGGTPLGVGRWGDSHNWIMQHGNEPGPEQFYRESYLRSVDWPRFREYMLEGLTYIDILGVNPDDQEAREVLTRYKADLSGIALASVYLHRLANSRREWADEVLGREWTVSLVGNHMPAYALWLREHFPKLRILSVMTAEHFPQVRAAMSLMEQSKPRLALCSAGWYTTSLVGHARKVGAVGISYGFTACHHMQGWYLPNTEGDRGPAGQTAWAKAHNPEGFNVDPQAREIVLPGRG